MNCFYHSDVAAVGICKNCNRGLCPACLIEFDNGLACKNRCENAVIHINQMIERSVKTASMGSKVHAGLGFMMLAFATPIMLSGLSAFQAGKTSSAVTSALFCLPFFFGAAMFLRYAKQLKEKAEDGQVNPQ